MCLLRGTFYILRSAHTVYLCVLCGSENKQRLFHCTALTDWLVFITETESVYCAVRTGFLYIIRVKLILESGNIALSLLLPTPSKSLTSLRPHTCVADSKLIL